MASVCRLKTQPRWSWASGWPPRANDWKKCIPSNIRFLYAPCQKAARRCAYPFHFALPCRAWESSLMSKLRLLIVDDEPLIRKGLRHALSNFSDIEVAGECGSGKDAIRAIS